MEEMSPDPRVFIMGEDIVCNVFGTTTGFVDMFGPARVDTLISENGFIGAAAGAAMVGLRPIVDARFPPSSIRQWTRSSASSPSRATSMVARHGCRW